MLSMASLCSRRVGLSWLVTAVLVDYVALAAGSVQKRAIQSLATTLDSNDLEYLSHGLSDMTTFMGAELDPFLIERVAGTPGNVQVRNHIVRQLSDLSAGWHVEQDSFQDTTPLGRKSFTNVIATLNPRAPRRLVLACHFDSKLFTNFHFVAATDSAVPCAMLIHLARKFNTAFQQRKKRLDTTLQLIFFDGEEAFVSWTATDSLYGSRHLAAKMQRTPHPYVPSINQLQAMDAFVLLDLLGNAQPRFMNFFPQTSSLFSSLQAIENRLHRQGLLLQHTQPFFSTSPARQQIQDDHVPFHQRGVPIVHLIPVPFPWTWHKATDTKANLDVNTIDSLNRIMRVFVAEYLEL